ncbi:MAG TPA: arylamine N-acetyltransferase [Chloroflexota bacterium]
MEGQPVPASWLERYLAFLGVEREVPGRDALARLVRAQIEGVVFENVTAILRRARTGEGPVPPVDPEALLGAWTEQRGGGVCFDLVPTFRRLLAGLGYRVQPLLAQISFPGSHHAALVEVGDGRYLVDIGGGSPLWRPIPIGETIEIGHAGLGFRLRPEGSSEYVQERRTDGDWVPTCRYDLRPADPALREAAYQRHQLAGETWVVGNLTLVRSTADAVHRLREDELVSYTADGKRVERLVDGADYRRVAAEVFGLPGLPIDEARAVLDEIRRARAG